MNTMEELKLREENMKRREEELNNELLHWKNRCLSVEKKVKKVEQQVERLEENNSEAAVPISTENKEDIQSVKSIIKLLQDDIHSVNGGFTALCNKTTDFFTSLKSDMNDLKQLVEQGKQYSMLNNALIHGFPRVPNLYGVDFIYSIVDKLNELFPSLPGPILPCHIDDAHPLRTRNINSNKVVIIRFSNRWIKDILMSCRNDLNGTGLMLTEHLTDFTQYLRSETAKIVGAVNTSVHKTRVYAKSNGIYTAIKNQKDLDKLKDYCAQFPAFISTSTSVPPSTYPRNDVPLGRGRGMANRGSGSHHYTH